MPDAALAEIRARRARWTGGAQPKTFGELAAWVEASADDVAPLLTALDEVLKLHSAYRLYDECSHEHTEDEVRAGLATDAGEFFACEEGFERIVCRHCCAIDGSGQTEDCAVTHLADECWPCPTIQAITRILLGEVHHD